MFAVFQMVVFVVTMLYADAFGSANEQPVNTNSVFLGTESDQVGINPDNVNIDISSDDDKSSIITYNVQKWDTLESISQEFWVTVAELKKINKLSWDISAGQKLIVSDNEDGILYVVQEAKTLKLFAEYYRLNLQDLITLNYFSDESEVLYPGQEIFINVSEQRAYEIGLLQREQPQLPKDELPVTKKNNSTKIGTKKNSASAAISYVWVTQTTTSSHNDKNNGTLIRDFLMVLLLVIVLGMQLMFLLGCMMLMVLGFLEEMLRIGMQMHKVQLQKLQGLKLLELLQK